MTAPRQVLRGTTYLVTRRCFQRQLLLRPSAVTNEIFLYVLAVAARRFGIEVHAFCVLSNHYHLVVTDPDARLPAFGQYLDGLVARAVNASLGRWESFWAPSSYSAVALTSPRDVVEKAAYVLANPVAAGLVRRGEQWPGLWSDPALVAGSAIVAARPRVFFRENGYMPEHATLTLRTPPGCGPAEAFRVALAGELQRLEEGHATEVRAFLGARGVRRQSPWAKPAGGERRRELNPRIAARDRWKRIEALCRLATFIAEYRGALRAWTAGMRDVLFPAGTYALRVTHRVACHGDC